MTILLTGAGGLFTRLGKIGKVADRMRVYQGTTLPTNISEVMAQYDTLRTAVGDVPAADIASRSAVSQIMQTLTADAQNTLLSMVLADKPSVSATPAAALQELINQMRTAVASVKTCAITATAAAFSTPVANAGNGVMVVSTKRGDGLVQENTIPEVCYVTCTTDNQTGGATLGQETFSYVGEPLVTDVWSDQYPNGSGQTTPLTAIDASVYQSATGNLLNNGDMESFTSNLPAGWAALVGVAGTDYLKSTAQVFDGAASLQYAGGATLTSLTQQFNAAGGTTAALQPDTVYVLNFWSKVDVVPAAGVLTVDLVDATPTTINDDQAVANTQAFTLSGFTTSFVAKSVVFRTPRSLPSTVKLRVRISTALSGGSNLFIDRMALTPASVLYPGGPVAAIFSGQTTAKFIAGDGFVLTTTNDYGGASNLSTFQQLFERLFGMRALGLLLPSNGAPTIADTLIST